MLIRKNKHLISFGKVIIVPLVLPVMKKAYKWQIVLLLQKESSLYDEGSKVNRTRAAGVPP